MRKTLLKTGNSLFTKVVEVAGDKHNMNNYPQTLHFKPLTKKNRKLNKYSYSKMKLPELLTYQNPSVEEEKKLLQCAQQGDLISQEKVVHLFMNLVISIAKNYQASSMMLDDLVQEGVIGLLTAIQKFDLKKKYRFSTYARYWIRQAISRAIENQAQIIRIPSHIFELLRQLDKVKINYIKENGSEPSINDLAEKINLLPERLETILSLVQNFISLDAPTYSKKQELMQVIEDRQSLNPEALFEAKELQEKLSSLVEGLNNREKQILNSRLKTFTENEKSGRAILAKTLKLSTERIRQIEIKLLKKLRYIGWKNNIIELKMTKE